MILVKTACPDADLKPIAQAPVDLYPRLRIWFRCYLDGVAVRPTRIKDLDFKPRSSRPWRKLACKRLHWIAAGFLGASALLFLLSPQDDAAAVARPTANGYLELPLELPARDTVRRAPDIPAPVAASATEPAAAASVEPVIAAEEPEWQLVEVRPGDSLAKIFSNLGLSAKNMYEVLAAGEAAKTLTRLYPGEQLRLLIDDARLQALRYAVDESVTLHIDLEENGYTTALVAVPLEHHLAYKTAIIESSLYAAGKSAGLSDALIMQLAEIFGWDIDFALDIRAGDAFVVIHEEVYRDGEKIRDGNIVAAEFLNRGRSYRAVAFVDEEGNRDYYTPDGKSMRKAFLRSPVDFRRISSGFNPNRLHPVLGTKRPHRGVDYAAPTGTPIRAAGDGKIVHLGWKGGYGRTIIIQHGSRYSTLYAHMSGYAKGLKQGSRVRQGQIIGYVGSSGLATGPHLHYEFLVDGVHRNPVTVPLPEAQPIAKHLLPAFLEQTAPLVAQLDVLSRTEIALRLQQHSTGEN
ncbi:MAG: peptidoglycan DD-metalloendopeptidase family protein [Xanthomonadaceae bacterium]|nr:peptidoglycan DD-metalloendopeptidase family protein [Xanthomonadaceae bacterium]